VNAGMAFAFGGMFSTGGGNGAGHKTRWFALV
jgi:hypothetical protein